MLQLTLCAIPMNASGRMNVPIRRRHVNPKPNSLNSLCYIVAITSLTSHTTCCQSMSNRKKIWSSVQKCKWPDVMMPDVTFYDDMT